MSRLYVKAPTEELIYTFDFSAQVPSGSTVSSVSIPTPTGLTVSGKTDDLANKTSRALFEGGSHGGVYVCTAEAVLSNGETIVESFTLRVVAGA